MSYGEGMTPADVAAVTRGGMGGFGGGFGYGDGGAIWLIILFFFAMMVGGGNRGFGGGYGGGADGNLYPWLNNSQNINGGFRDQLLATNVNGLQNAVTAGLRFCGHERQYQQWFFAGGNRRECAADGEHAADVWHSERAAAVLL